MPFRPYHTGLRKQVEFDPIDTGIDAKGDRVRDEHGNPIRNVLMYNCGPTVYGVPHIGNYRSFLFADLLRRYLDWRVDDDGTRYRVTQVMNITDVGHLTEDDRADAGGEDKLQAMAEKLGWDPFRVARHFEELFFADLEKLGVRKAHHYPRATEHVADMLDMIQALLDRGHAYIADGTGEVYFSVPSYKEYGWLSGKDIEANVAGARVDVLDVKRDPRDFALWKVDAKHLMQWDPQDARLWATYTKDTGRPVPKLDPRIGRGFPGWHIECSAMSRRYLGVTFDVHTGGEDNIFPHHECEIAQSVGANAKPFVNTWMHARHLLVDGKKMSKSAGTLYTLADLEAKGFTAAEVRWALLREHYRSPMNFTMEGMESARVSLTRLRSLKTRLWEQAGEFAELAFAFGGAGGLAPHCIENLIVTEEHRELRNLLLDARNWRTKSSPPRLVHQFQVELDEDLGIGRALAVLFDWVAMTNEMLNKDLISKKLASFWLAAFASVDSVLGVLSIGETVGGIITKDDALGASPLSEDELQALLESVAAGNITVEAAKSLIIARFAAKKAKDFALADRIRTTLSSGQVVLEDTPQGVRWQAKQGIRIFGR